MGPSPTAVKSIPLLKEYHQTFINFRGNEKQIQGWPGDKEGRTLLGLVLLEQVTGRPAKHLEASLDLYFRRVNARGYLGPVMAPDAIHEQTLGGQFWMLNAFYEYEAWKKDGRVNPWADHILNNIYLASADAYPRYPITPAERKTQSFKLADGRTGKWDLAPMDIGCGMAGSLDALTDAYARHPSKETGRVLDTVIKRWQEIQLEAIHAQLHSTLIRVNGADRVDYRTFHYGPLMLGYTGQKAVTVKPDARFSRRGERDFLVEGTDLVLQPIYHLLDPAVSKNRGYRRQILFP